MKQLFDAGVRNDVLARVTRLRPDSERLWGTMSPAQALAHCAASLEMARGNVRPPRVFLGRIIGGLLKRVALGNDAPMRRNTPTVSEIAMAEPRDFEVERRKLLASIEQFGDAGPACCTSYPHPFFGRLTPQEWSIFQYKHLDHHLRQFAV